MTHPHEGEGLGPGTAPEELRQEKLDRDVNLPRLVQESQVGEPASSVLIRGDAEEALRLLALEDASAGTYVGKVKLCYIDPPFNTGEIFEHYHDRQERGVWLEALRKQLTRVRDLLAPDGSVWVHIDDSEQHRARCVLDEVFGEGAFVATVIWQKRKSRDSRKAFSSMHDYIHVYAPAGPVAWKRIRNGLPDEGAFANPDQDPRGPWRSVPMTVQAGHATASQFYTVVSPAGEAHEPPAGRCWTYTKERLAALDADGRVYWPRSGAGKPRLKRYASEGSTLAPFTIWTSEEVGDNAGAKKALRGKFPRISTFDTPKPEGLLERIVSVATNEGELVLDCYLGSGTTAVVAQRLGRPWIGVELNDLTVQAFVLPRLREEIRTMDGGGFRVMRVEM